MKEMLGRASAVAAGALMMVGLGATAACAHVAVGGIGGGVVSAEDPFEASWGEGFATTGEVHDHWKFFQWSTDEEAGGQGGDLAWIGHHHMG
ncbi:hypothetical protein E6W39_25100 [Kitasatospora acidiphila]|uniref:Lipoprotein n=1 Tax=Kitasatospora acidiphila TaxID=2567942 RepID=A0A540W7C4_9ACTN|nr:hypothetical protein [Kitasatospora acidiphila]TQF04909.1 hypothetical protein E6W39_25100 [Kitasatospora acidiphila]